MVLVALAAYPRLAHLDVVELKRDEADLALRALDLVGGRAFPLTGIGTSLPGVENGPLMVYLVAIPLALSRDPGLASGFVGLLNVLAVLATALTAGRFFGPRVGLATGIAYAAGSWAIVFSRKLWTNEAMPLFVALLALGLHEAVVRNRARGLIVAGVALGALLNLHPTGALFVPFVALGLLLRPARLRSRAALAGAGVVALLSLPYLAHEVTRGLPTLRALRRSAGAPGGGVDAAALRGALEIVGPDAFRVLSGGERGHFDAGAVGLGPAELLLGAALPVGVAFGCWLLFRARRDGAEWRGPALALLWLLVPLAAASWRALPFQIHYLIPLLPPLFAFVGLGAAWWRPVAPLAVVALGLLAAVQLQHFETLVPIVREAGVRTLFGVPLGAQRAAVRRAAELAAGGPIVLVSQPNADGVDDLPSAWRLLLPEGQALEFANGRGPLRLTTDERVFVVAPSAERAAVEAFATYGARDLGTISLPGVDGGYSVWRGLAKGAPGQLARLENGLLLSSAAYPRILRSSEPFVLDAVWRVGRTLPGEELALFAQLLDDRRNVLAVHDVSGVDARSLRPGDEIIQWARFATSTAPGRYWLSLGVRYADGGTRVAVVDPLGESVRFALKSPLPTETAIPSVPLARFADGIVLVGAQVAGSPPTVELTWMALGRPSQDLTVFVHFLDTSGRLVAQDDRQPMDGRYPTGIWDAGERIPDRHPVAVPPGRYRVVVGMYDPNTGARLPRLEGGDSYEVGVTEVAPSG